ncbi:hypothetical protein AcV5_009699 [Taiwanofungus camphoratus]|nr:hypothetical protein AcV5_009699 [Antrodia cinnamomea]
MEHREEKNAAVYLLLGPGLENWLYPLQGLSQKSMGGTNSTVKVINFFSDRKVQSKISRFGSRAEFYVQVSLTVLVMFVPLCIRFPT